MKDSDRILTVSYGGLTYKVEGFDNPFKVMKAIADHLETYSENSDRPATAQDLAKAAAQAEEKPVQGKKNGGEIVLSHRPDKKKAKSPPPQQGPVETDTKPARPRLVKVKHADLFAAIARHSPNEDYEDEGPAQQKPKPTEPAEPADASVLSPEAEADLQSKLTAIESELQPEAGETDDAPPQTSDTSGADPQKNNENALHLSQFKIDPEQRKAPATKAPAKSRTPGPGPQSGSSGNSLATLSLTDAYKTGDNTKAAAFGVMAEMSSTHQPSLLRLSPESRLNLWENMRATEETAPSAAGKEDPATDFAGFIKPLELPETIDLLEAAAAFLTDVKGQRSFKRPQLFGMLKEAQGSRFSRKQAFHALEALLTSGTLQKLEQGQLAATRLTRFRDRL